LQCFPTLWESPKYSLRRRTVDESSYRVGMGDWPPVELGTSTARTSTVGCASGRRIFTYTTGCDRRGSSRHLSTSPKLSHEPQLAANGLRHSGRHAYNRFFWDSRACGVRASWAGHSSPSNLLDDQ